MRFNSFIERDCATVTKVAKAQNVPTQGGVREQIIRCVQSRLGLGLKINNHRVEGRGMGRGQRVPKIG